MEQSSHAQRIEQAFTHQAAAFEDPARNRIFTTGSQWVFERLLVDGEMLVLDVAAGTGHAARQLARSARSVVAIDATTAMLEQGRAQARLDGVSNVVFMRGDAAALPFLDATFDVVVSRFAVHHFEQPVDVIAEMTRCTRPGGSVAVVDLIADPLDAMAQEQNRLELLRDPSHTRMLPVAELERLMIAAGLGSVDVETRPVERPLQPWLEQAGVAVVVADGIRERLWAEIAGGAPTGFRPEVRDGELWFVQTFASCIAHRPA
jgi:ubiquinone/menaquinone biosynthesis C-methylase UbiE